MDMLQVDPDALSDGNRPAAGASGLLAIAQELRNANLAGATPALLRGKNVALVCRRLDADRERRLELAATRLGARVSQISPAGPLRAAYGSEETAQLLTRLYDAIDCADLPESATLALRSRLAVPVYSGLARPDHPVMALLEELQSDPSDPAATDEARIALIQAVLSTTIRR
jgi:ornithine carbamoyltransferase